MRIAIEGLIGVGKSTVMELLRDQHELDIRLEPIEAWTLLSQYYAAPQKEAFSFEMQVLTSYCHNSFDDNCIMERSPNTALGVFVKMMRQDGLLTETEFDLLHTAATNLNLKKPDAFVYIRAPVDVCLERIAWRNRGTEARSVTKEYLVKLQKAQDNFFESTVKQVMFVDLDGHESPQQVANMVADCIRILRVRT